MKRGFCFSVMQGLLVIALFFSYSLFAMKLVKQNREEMIQSDFSVLLSVEPSSEIFFSHLFNKDILSLRLVCKEYSKIVSKNMSYFQRCLKEKAFYDCFCLDCKNFPEKKELDKLAKIEYAKQFLSAMICTSDNKCLYEEYKKNDDCYALYSSQLRSSLQFSFMKHCNISLIDKNGNIVNIPYDQVVATIPESKLSKTAFIWVNWQKYVQNCDITPFLSHVFREHINAKIIFGEYLDNQMFDFNMYPEVTQNIINVLLQFKDCMGKRTVVDSYGKTVLHYACGLQNKELVKKLCPLINERSYNIVGKTAFHEACLSINDCRDDYTRVKGLRFISFLMKMGLGNLGTKTLSGKTPLMLAAGERGDDDLLRYFLQQASDLDINEKDYRGRTALHFACKNPRLCSITIKNLIQHSNALNMIDKDRNTLLHYFSQSNDHKIDEKTVELVWLILQKMLGKFNAQAYLRYFDIRNKVNQTAIDIAKTRENIILENFLEHWRWHIKSGTIGKFFVKNQE